MTHPLRIRTRIDSETLHLPEFRPLIGKDVEIIVIKHDVTSPAAASRGNGERAGRDAADWRSRFEAMLAEARAGQRHLPAGYAADDSREALYGDVPK